MSESLMTLEEILCATRGKSVGFARNEKKFFFDSVCIDSRKVKKSSLFIALNGKNQDGHNFVPNAIENGATCVMISRESYLSNENDYMEMAFENENLMIIVVEDTLQGLQDAAHGYLKKFPNLKKIAITGSSGKTTTKEILASILRQKYCVLSNRGNLNSETGLPLSIFEIKAEHEIAVMEAGMNRAGEIEELAKCYRPNFCAITNIANAHIGILKTRMAIASEKKKIFNYIEENGVALIPKNCDFKDFLAKDVQGKIIFFGEDENPKIKFVQDCGIDGIDFLLEDELCKLNLPGHYNFENAICAIEMAKQFSLSNSQIKAALENFFPIFGRGEIIRSRFTIMRDCYNANPDSFEKSLEFCNGVKLQGKKIFVLGDMLELGDESFLQHQKIVKLALQKFLKGGADFLIFVGSEMKNAVQSLKCEFDFDLIENSFLKSERPCVFVFESSDSETVKKIAQKIQEIAIEKDFILLKASRALEFERIAEAII